MRNGQDAPRCDGEDTSVEPPTHDGDDTCVPQLRTHELGPAGHVARRLSGPPPQTSW